MGSHVDASEPGNISLLPMAGSTAQSVRNGLGQAECLRLHLHVGLFENISDHHLGFSRDPCPRQRCLSYSHSFRRMHTIHEALGCRWNQTWFLLECDTTSHIWILWRCSQHIDGLALHHVPAHLYCEGAASQANHLGCSRSVLVWSYVSVLFVAPLTCIINVLQYNHHLRDETLRDEILERITRPYLFVRQSQRFRDCRSLRWRFHSVSSTAPQDV